MKKTNDAYCIVFQGKRVRERYYRDADGWLKVSARGNVFRATAEQVLNHVLPALAFGGRLGLTVTVEHYPGAYWRTRAARADRRAAGAARSGTRRSPAVTSAEGTRASPRPKPRS